MSLIKSISGIRGTIGGSVGDNLTPIDIVKFVSAYGQWLKEKNNLQSPKVVIGRDARISGQMVESLVSSTLQALGIEVLNAGLCTTPTVEMGVKFYQATGGIIITASHNPKQWNALKLLNSEGEFISDLDGKRILELAENAAFDYVNVDLIGKQIFVEDLLNKHIEAILQHPLVDKNAIADKKFHVVLDAVNSVGGIAVPALLEALGVKQVTKLYCEPDGHFPRNPEPLPEHLTEISDLVPRSHAHLGIVVDPDVDRLALVCEDGSMFGEEYTLVAIADYILSNKKGNAVSNLSSSKALADIATKRGGNYFASAVGEVNVVACMKEVDAVIGGEGNGGIIVPELHYGRDALIGIALFLTHLAKSDLSCSRLRALYPNYYMSKGKIELDEKINMDALFEKIKNKYKNYPLNTIDGIKINLETEWVHIRRSNTEPIIRVYSESTSQNTADALVNKIKVDIKQLQQEEVE